jgi:HD-like signal output (HDOD) protein
MKELIIEKIDSLPPLPKSVIELEEYRKQPEKEPLDLLKIIEQDPLIITTLLRVANSAMFGFRSEVETPSRAINLLGVNFTISIALGSVVQDLIKTDLSAYGVSTDDFLMTANLASTMVNTWIGPLNFELKEELLLPAFLQETGKFIISELVADNGRLDQFKVAIQSQSRDTTEVETKFAGVSCAKITANIFKHWKLSHNLVFAIGFVGETDKCPPEFLEKVQVLEIIKILCDITDPLGSKQVEKALSKAKKYGLDTIALGKAIKTVQRKISENS